MDIIISNSKDEPIYEQIKNQLKNLIVSGDLKEDDLLPGMRSLAKDLKVSVITTKRAYNDLEKEGYIYTVVGKGCFVKGLNREIIKEEQLKEIQEHLEQAFDLSKKYGVGFDKLIEILNVLKEG